MKTRSPRRSNRPSETAPDLEAASTERFDLGRLHSFGVEEYHHFCLNVADVDGTLAELRSRGVDVLGDAIDLEAIDRRLGFFKDNNDNIIELASPLR